MERDDLTSKQSDYATFLPAISSFFSGYIGRQRYTNHIDPVRIPSRFENGVEGINFLNSKEGYFHYKWALYSAGHAVLDVNKHEPKEDMVRNRDRQNTILVGDSGGFQIGKGVWEGDWKNPQCPKSAKQRKLVLDWMDKYMDWGMILDIPAWVCRSPAGRKATGITTYSEAVEGTRINNDYFMANRTGECKFLNVLQGENHKEADDWYQQMKDYCDPNIYPNTHFNGWSMGGQNMCDIHLALKRLIALKFDGLLESGIHDWMHFLGTSKLEWACLLTDIQRAVRAHHNPTFTISFDCASPFLATANGQIYTNTDTNDRSKWTYRMQPSVDDKRYATDARTFRDAVLQDKIFKDFTESPISARLDVKDVCIYKPGDLNKIGKEGKTSWDSFSYALQMSHNVWSHIEAVQQANRAYDSGSYPSMLIREVFEREIFRDIVNDIFAAKTRENANAIIEKYDRFWQAIVGTRGATGKKTVNASTHFFNFFSSSEEEESHVDTETDDALDVIDKLEENL